MTVTDRPPIVTARFGYDDSHTLARFLVTDGYEGLRIALARTPEEVTAEVKAATIQGRAGANFPCGTKWSSLPAGVFPRWVVVNGDESEPGTYKDRMLMERDPHQLIEGTLICAYAVRASQAFIYVRGEMALAQERLAAALNEAYAQGYAGKNILGTPWSMDVVLHWGAGAYIVGEETALLESLEGGRGQPRIKPPLPVLHGLYGDPTVVNNVETLSNLGWLMRHGAAAYTAIGSETSKGMRMFTVSGHVERPGVYEVELGATTFRDLIYDERYGGGIRGGRQLKAFIPGGGSSNWFYAEHLDVPLDVPVVAKEGSMLGSGAVIVMDETTDMVRAAWRLVRFFARESCGKCVPCREGTGWLEKIYRRILTGHGRPDDVELLLAVTESITPGLRGWPSATTICPLGPSVAGALVSSVSRFRDEYDAYLNKASSEPAGAA